MLSCEHQSQLQMPNQMDSYDFWVSLCIGQICENALGKSFHYFYQFITAIPIEFHPVRVFDLLGMQRLSDQ